MEECKNEKKIRFYNVDFLRFILAVQIVMLHSMNQTLGMSNFEFITLLGSRFQHWRIAVDYFFIIAGFFMFYNINKEYNTLEYAKKRFLRLAPLLWVLILICALFSLFIKGWGFSFDGQMLRILLLQTIGFNPVTGGPATQAAWFISTLFWSSLFYFYLNKIIDKKYMNIIVWILIIISYSTILHKYNWSINGITENVYYFINLGILRGLGGLGIGYFLSYAFKSGLLQNCTQKGKVFISVIECFLVIFFIHYTLLCPKIPGKSAFTYIVYFSIFFYFLLINQGIISKILNNKYLAKLGKYSYSIYIIHPVVIYFLYLTLYKSNVQFIQNHLLVSYSFIIISSILTGILTYHIIEKPINKFISQKFLKH